MTDKKLIKFLMKINDLRAWGLTDPDEILKSLYRFWVRCNDEWGVDVLPIEYGYDLIFQTVTTVRGKK